LTHIETTVVERTVHIAARPETVWEYWTDPQLVCDWWGAAAELDARPGGTYRVEMEQGSVMRGEYLELVPYERIVFSFGWEPANGVPPLPPGSSTVEVSLVPHGGDTILTVRHTLPAHLEELHQSGWAHYLARLATTAGVSR
jgi:uncharacterized protein YndB with AHSA1/START domain